MAKILLRSVLQLGLLLDTVKGIEVLHPTPVTVGQLDLRANPEPTPRATLEEKAEIIGRSDYNTLCGYADANSLYPVSCIDGYICATAANYYAAGCCDPNELAYCTLPSACVPYGYYCDETCLLENVAYTSCGILAPYCLTLVYQYDMQYTEYDCATFSGIVTIQTYAKGLATTDVVTSIAHVTQTIATTASATALADTGGAGGGLTQNIINCENGSTCNGNGDNGNGNGNSGNGNGNTGGGKNIAAITTPVSGLCLISLVCIVVFAWL